VTLPEKNRVQLKLINGTTDEPDPDHPQKYYKLRFETYYIPLDLSNYKFREPKDKKTKEMSIRELRTEYNRLKNEHGFAAHNLTAEIHRKIASAFSIFVFALIGIPLALITRRSEKSFGFAIALVLSTIYWSLLMGVTALAKTGTVPAILCLHMPNLLYTLIGLTMMKKLMRT